MRKLYCPDCGRYCGETDAPPGYVVRIPRCKRCRDAKTLVPEAAEPRAASPPRPPCAPKR